MTIDSYIEFKSMETTADGIKIWTDTKGRCYVFKDDIELINNMTEGPNERKELSSNGRGKDFPKPGSRRTKRGTKIAEYFKNRSHG